jgi:hypothetical protein
MKAFGIVFTNDGSYEDYSSSLSREHIYSSWNKANDAVNTLIDEQKKKHQQLINEGYSIFPGDTWNFDIITLEIK